jgi:mono/diheme cytochrome c family protein
LVLIDMQTSPSANTLHLATLFVAALATACSQEAPPASNNAAADDRPLTAAAPIYASMQNACAVCHGPDGAGGPMGPSLDGIEADWNEADLVSFIRDPVPWLGKSARLNEVHSRYPVGMTPPKDMSDKDAALLARWLLAGRPK